MEKLKDSVLFEPYLREPDQTVSVCPTCGTRLYDHYSKTIREQLSISGRYCEECIMRLDTRQNRQLWLREESAYTRLLEYHFTGEVGLIIPQDAITSAEFWCMQWKRKFQDEYNEVLHEYIKDEYEHQYMTWLLETN